MIDKFFDELFNRTCKKTVDLSFSEKKCDVTSSKLGGAFYIPKGGDFPVSLSSKEKLYPFIQINFEQMPHIDHFPSSGILQFFILDSRFFQNGLDTCNPTVQDNWRVVYYDKIEEPMDEAMVRRLMPVLPSGYESAPPYDYPNAEYKIEFEIKDMPMSLSDYRFDSIALDILNDLFDDKFKDISSKYDLPRDLYKEIYDKLSFYSSRLGGYASFRKDDPRLYVNDNYELLLQIDSIFDSVSDEYITMWGDMGIANLFITESDLKKCEFSNILYHWDCY